MSCMNFGGCRPVTLDAWDPVVMGLVLMLQEWSCAVWKAWDAVIAADGCSAWAWGSFWGGLGILFHRILRLVCILTQSV